MLEVQYTNSNFLKRIVQNSVEIVSLFMFVVPSWLTMSFLIHKFKVEKSVSLSVRSSRVPTLKLKY